jgi:hypothetical protein
MGIRWLLFLFFIFGLAALFYAFYMGIDPWRVAPLEALLVSMAVAHYMNISPPRSLIEKYGLMVVRRATYYVFIFLVITYFILFLLL